VVLRIEYLVSEIMSGKNAIPLDDFVKDGASMAELSERMAKKHWGTEAATDWMKSSSCASSHAKNSARKK